MFQKFFNMAAKIKMAAKIWVFSLFEHQKFSFSLQLLEMTNSNDVFQKAG